MPRDTCHTPGPTGTCPGGKFGNGAWARDAYLSSNNGTTAAAVATAVGKTATTLTRWDVYKWQLADKANRLANKVFKDVIPPDFKENGKSGKGTYTFTNRCSIPQPVNGTAVVPSTSQKDRRVLTVAAVDCSGLSGKGNVFVKQWVDVFLVEPSLDRSAGTTGDHNSGKSEIYVEIIGVAQRPNGQSAFQYYLRQRPRLLR
jgi:hypothetical protein